MPLPQITIPSPGPRWISFITLYLRATLGLQLLRIAISSYLARVAYGSGQRTPALLLPAEAPIILIDVSQYLLIAFSLALILGFFTRFSAASIGVLLASSIAIRLVLEVRAGMAANQANALDMLNLAQLLQYISLQLVLLVWLSGTVNNLYSLDGLMFLTKRHEEKPKAAPAHSSPRLTGGSSKAKSESLSEREIPRALKPWVTRELDFNDPEFGVPSKGGGEST